MLFQSWQHISASPCSQQGPWLWFLIVSHLWQVKPRLVNWACGDKIVGLWPDWGSPLRGERLWNNSSNGGFICSYLWLAVALKCRTWSELLTMEGVWFSTILTNYTYTTYLISGSIKLWLRLESWVCVTLQFLNLFVLQWFERAITY